MNNPLKYLYYRHESMPCKILWHAIPAVVPVIAIVCGFAPQAAAGVLTAGFFHMFLWAVYVVFLNWCKKNLLSAKITAAAATNYFMWWTMGKMAACMVCLFVFIRWGGGFKPFLVTFGVLWMLLMLYEIFSVRELNTICTIK